MRLPYGLIPVLLITGAAAHSAGLPVALPSEQGMDSAKLAHLDGLILETIRSGGAPGAVCIVGRDGKIVYRKAFGDSTLVPERRPMPLDTVFDLASLTKVVATTSSIMALVEDGRLSLNTRVASIWPEYGVNGKEDVTVRQLLTHTAGLSAGHPFFARYGQENAASHPGSPDWKDQSSKVYGDLAAAAVRYTPDSRLVYSDDGFMSLGEIVRRVSGERLDRYVKHRIFAPLKMNDTTFLPGPALANRAAPTEQRFGRWLKGEVHDPSSWTLGGVAGHAGLFSTADDLARFCQMLLNGGELGGNRVLSPATVRAMTSPATPEGLPIRGLGWDIDSGYTRRGDLYGVGGFGHTGWTGTSLWVDPTSKTFIVLLTNRNHPKGGGGVSELQRRVSTLVAGAVTNLPGSSRTAASAAPRPDRVEPGKTPPLPLPFANVKSGIDVLQEEKFDRLKGRKIGLITNPTGINRQRQSTADLIFEQHQAGVLQLVAFFGPEHGIRADLDEVVKDEKDAKTGLPVYSLYDYARRIFKPTPEMLKGIDTLVFDVQDIGVRYYTYITTMAHAMEAASENNIRIVVLDRPNPVNGVTIDGPNLDLVNRSFAGYYPIPIRHGMTVGELAKFFNTEYKIGADLDVVPCKNWRRTMWFDQTGQPWVNPSPNIRNLNQAALYTSTGLLEAAKVSVGRGTDRPFELFGAPYMDDVKLAEELNRLQLPGLSFIPHQFTPATREFRGQLCKGVNVQLLDRDALEGARSAVAILDALRRLYGEDKVGVAGTKGMFGTKEIPDAIIAGRTVSEIAASWQNDIESFRRTRTKYLMY